MSAPRYWRENVRRSQFLGDRCKSCGKTYISPRSVCPRCGSTELETVKLSGRGSIYSYTVVRAPPEERKNDAPYTIGIVELEEGARLTAEIVDCKPEEVQIGMPVEVVFRRVGQDGDAGVIFYGYKFRRPL